MTMMARSSRKSRRAAMSTIIELAWPMVKPAVKDDDGHVGYTVATASGSGAWVEEAEQKIAKMVKVMSEEAYQNRVGDWEREEF